MIHQISFLARQFFFFLETIVIYFFLSEQWHGGKHERILQTTKITSHRLLGSKEGRDGSTLWKVKTTSKLLFVNWLDNDTGEQIILQLLIPAINLERIHRDEHCYLWNDMVRWYPFIWAIGIHSANVLCACLGRIWRITHKESNRKFKKAKLLSFKQRTESR